MSKSGDTTKRCCATRLTLMGFCMYSRIIFASPIPPLREKGSPSPHLDRFEHSELVNKMKDEKIVVAAPVYRHLRNKRVEAVQSMDKSSLTESPGLQCRCEYPSEGIYNGIGDSNSTFVSENGFTVLPSTFFACQDVVFVCPDTFFDGALWNYDCLDLNTTDSIGVGKPDFGGYVVVLPKTYFLCQCQEATDSDSSNAKRVVGKGVAGVVKFKAAKKKNSGVAKGAALRSLSSLDLGSMLYSTPSSYVRSFGKHGKSSKGARRVAPTTRAIQFLQPTRCSGPTPAPHSSDPLGASPSPVSKSGTYLPTVTTVPNLSTSTSPPTATRSPATTADPTSQPTSKIIPFAVVPPSRPFQTQPSQSSTQMPLRPSKNSNVAEPVSADVTGDDNQPGIRVPQVPHYHLVGGLFILTNSNSPSPGSNERQTPTSQPTSRIIAGTLEPTRPMAPPFSIPDPGSSNTTDPDAILPGILLPDRPSYNVSGKLGDPTQAHSTTAPSDMQSSPTLQPTSRIIPDTFENPTNSIVAQSTPYPTDGGNKGGRNSPGLADVVPGLTLPERPDYNLTGTDFGPTSESQTSPTSQPTSRIVPDTQEPTTFDEGNEPDKGPDPDDVLPGINVPARPDYNITGKNFFLTSAPSRSPATSDSRSSPTAQPTSRIIPDTLGPDGNVPEKKPSNDPNNILPGTTLPDPPDYNITAEGSSIPEAPSPSHALP